MQPTHRLVKVNGRKREGIEHCHRRTEEIYTDTPRLDLADKGPVYPCLELAHDRRSFLAVLAMDDVVTDPQLGEDGNASQDLLSVLAEDDHRPITILG